MRFMVGKGAAALVYASLIEGVGLPMLAATRCATPVLRSNTSPLSEVGGDEVLAGLAESATGAIVDPPRVGCRPAALKALLPLVPRRLVYVWCDASRLARDLRVLADGVFTVRSVQPIHMLPQTYHLENLSLLTSRQ